MRVMILRLVLQYDVLPTSKVPVGNKAYFRCTFSRHNPKACELFGTAFLVRTLGCLTWSVKRYNVTKIDPTPTLHGLRKFTECEWILQHEACPYVLCLPQPLDCAGCCCQYSGTSTITQHGGPRWWITTMHWVLNQVPPKSLSRSLTLSSSTYPSVSADVT